MFIVTIMLSNGGSSLRNKKAYPKLSKMDLDILSLPVMSSDPERAFFTAKITLSDRRNKMGIEMLEYLECLKSWTGPIE